LKMASNGNISPHVKANIVLLNNEILT